MNRMTAGLLWKRSRVLSGQLKCLRNAALERFLIGHPKLLGRLVWKEVVSIGMFSRLLLTQLVVPLYTYPYPWQHSTRYDTAQEHIITDSVFRNCGFRSDEYDQYNSAPDRGCGDESEADTGCSQYSTTFGFLTHSDEFTPEIMQGTRNITFDNCGRRFRFTTTEVETVSGRGQNWLDVDGSISGFGEATLIGSGVDGAYDWWAVEEASTCSLILLCCFHFAS